MFTVSVILRGADGKGQRSHLRKLITGEVESKDGLKSNCRSDRRNPLDDFPGSFEFEMRRLVTITRALQVLVGWIRGIRHK